MADDSNPFELVDDDGDDAPPPKPAPSKKAEAETPADDPLPALELEPDLEEAPPSAPKPEPEAAPEPDDDEPEEIQLDDAGEAPKTTADKTLVDEGPTDGSTVRMSLADVVHAWDEEAPDGLKEAAAAAADGEPKKDRSQMKRIVAMVLVIVAILGVIIVLFGACAPVAHADEATEALAEEGAGDLREIGVDLDGIDMAKAPTLTRRQAPPGCCWRDWQFAITPYGFLASVEGDVFADGDNESIKIPFEDLIKRTTGGGMLNVVVGYKRWFLELDGIYGRVGDSFNIGSTSIDIRIKQYQLDAAIGYRLIGRPAGRWTGTFCCNPPEDCCKTAVAVYAGVRYNQTDTTINISRPGGVLPGIQRRSTNSSNYAKPFIGLAWRQKLGRNWHMRLRGDIGTGELNDETSEDWRFEAVWGWRFHKHMSVVFGYRFFNSRNVRESGGITEGTDLLQHGPILGVKFDF